MKASDILSNAIGHLSDRAVTYDNPQGERSMAKTVAALNAIYNLGMTEVQGWHFMELLKMVRSSQGDFKSDNFEDGAAYAALAGEAAYSSNGVKSDESETPCATGWINWELINEVGRFYWYRDRQIEEAYNSKSVKSDEENHGDQEIPYVIIEGAPSWANWTSRDKDGNFYLYLDKPILGPEGWFDGGFCRLISNKIDGDISDEKFENSLRRVYRSQEEADSANGKSAG